MPAMRRSICASFLKSNPTLLQPIYSVYLSTPQIHKSQVISVLHDKHATIIQEMHNKYNKTCVIQCELQGIHSTDFSDYINQVSDNKSFITHSTFIRWDKLAGELYSNDAQHDILINKQAITDLNKILVEAKSISSLPIELISIITDYTLNTTSNIALLELVKKLRGRVGLKDELPKYSDYHDKF
jgi:translation elongation factor EF-G